MKLNEAPGRLDVQKLSREERIVMGGRGGKKTSEVKMKKVRLRGRDVEDAQRRVNKWILRPAEEENIES